MTKDKKASKSTYSPKILSVQEIVEQNKRIISGKLSGSNIKKLNNFNWLRHEISYTEPRILFWRNIKEQSPYFDYSCTKGLGDAYDYMLEQTQKKVPLDIREICNIHYLICNERTIKINDSQIRPGVIKKTNVPMEIETALENIIYRYQTSEKPAIIRAFDMHYQIIELQAFDDYNKRTARIIMNWALLENGYRPIVFTRKTDKESYPAALLNMKRNDTKSYYKYMYNAMRASQEKIIAQLKSSNIK